MGKEVSDKETNSQWKQSPHAYTCQYHGRKQYPYNVDVPTYLEDSKQHITLTGEDKNRGGCTGTFRIDREYYY